ncbi:MAG TPA: MBL fold metallo-hydrolase [Xanthomonadales bacterium]|nr:MBL fold metallo-hydrolase [Xanthomonadales bacterium]
MKLAQKRQNYGQLIAGILMVLGLVFCSISTVQAQDNFEINAGLNDAWFNPATQGQGFFITVFPDSQQMFLAWFTYDTERPDPSVTAILGEPGHRWLTAFGSYSGDSAELDIEVTSGGTFDSATPAVSQEMDGTVTVEFSDCENGLITYDITSLSLQGVIPISRIALDNVPGCEALLPEESDPVVLKYIGNLGVMISHQDKEVVIDGVLGNVAGWVAPDVSEMNRIINAQAPYQDIEVAGTTHGHGDHVSYTAVNTMLSNQPNTVYIGATTEGVGNVSNQNRVQRADMARFTNEQYSINGIDITVYHTRHFNQFGNDFSGVTNLAFLVELGGKKILHVGDFDYRTDNINALGLEPGELDAIIMPTFNTLISASNFGLIQDLLEPRHIVAAHFQSGSLVSQRNGVLNLVPDAIIFDTANEEFVIE